MLPKVQPAHIGTIAEGLGLAPEEYDLYGTTQAKVCASAYSSICLRRPRCFLWLMITAEVQVKLSALEKRKGGPNGLYGA